MKKALIALICIAVVFSFTACEKSAKTKLIGTWEGEDITLALNKDKTYTALGFYKYYDSMYLDEEEYGTFSFNDSKIVFVPASPGPPPGRPSGRRSAGPCLGPGDSPPPG